MLTREELAMRIGLVGSSDVPAIVGCSPWKSRADVLKGKLDPSSAEKNASFQLGHKLERPIAELALEQGDLGGGAHLVPGWTVVEDGWMSATPDFFALRTEEQARSKRRPPSEEEAILVEVKAVGWRQLPHWDWGKKLPDYVACQAQWQMRVLGHSAAKVAALIGGAEVKVFDVERDDFWIAQMERECRAFWELHLAPGKRNKVWARVALERLRKPGARKAA